MAGRAIFKGVIRTGDVDVPVKLHSAVREERVHFHLLHEKDHVRLEQRMYCSKEDEPVDPDDRVRGYEVRKGQYVVLDPEEIKAARPETDRAMEILHFVDEDEIDPRLYDRPYYLSPDGEEKPYALLARALNETDRVGICRWAMRGKSYLGLLKPLDDLLLLVTLRHAHEVVDTGSLDLEHPEVKEKELEMAGDLIDELTSDFDPSEYRDEHQQRLMELIEKKAKGEEPEVEEAEAREATRPSELQEKLEASLEEARAG
jgi:DNA end-binding protein Ku